MESYKIDWFDLVHDVIQRLEAGDAHSYILADLYYGIEAEIVAHHLNAQEDDIEYFAREFFICMKALCKSRNFARLKKCLVLAIPSNRRPMWLLMCRSWLKDLVLFLPTPLKLTLHPT